MSARTLDIKNATGRWGSETFVGDLTHGRAYAEDELWENYEYMIRKVAPVAEEAGVYIGIHPDDPPVYALGGIPRCIFGNFAGYKRAMDIADSPNIGVCLCVGCWLEGGKQGMGASVEEAIHYFGARNKLFKIHFRNVSNPMPEPWVETLMDDGYQDMHRVMQALRAVEFDGSDHSRPHPRDDRGQPRWRRVLHSLYAGAGAGRQQRKRWGGLAVSAAAYFIGHLPVGDRDD